MPKSVSGIGLPVALEASTTRVVLRSLCLLVAKHWKTRQNTMNNRSRETLNMALNELIVHNIQSICKLKQHMVMETNRYLDHKEEKRKKNQKQNKILRQIIR